MPYNFQDIKKRLTRLGFEIVRQKWSHVIFSNWNITFPVPHHWWKDISPGVEKTILKIVWISKEDFKNSL